MAKKRAVREKVEEGVKLIKAEKYSQAKDCFLVALDLDPLQTDAWNGLGYVYKNTGLIDEALRVYNESLNINSKNIYTWKSLGECYRLKGDYDRALDCYDKVEMYDSEDISIKEMKEKLETERKEYVSNKNKAQEKIGEAAKLVESEEYERAEECFILASEIDPKQIAALNGLGWLYERREAIDDAFRVYNLAIKIDPGNANALMGIGNIYHKKKNYDMALECYDKALMFDSNNTLSHKIKKKREVSESKKRENIIRETYEFLTNAQNVYEKLAFKEIRSRTGIDSDDLILLIETSVNKGKLNARIRDNLLVFKEPLISETPILVLSESQQTSRSDQKAISKIRKYRYIIAGCILIVLSIISFASIGNIYGNMSFSRGIQDALISVLMLIGAIFLALGIMSFVLYFVRREKSDLSKKK